MKKIKSPEFIYGTAWKNERTEELVLKAVKAGFRNIDTACQRKHYFEKAVGDALLNILNEGKLNRDDFFIQTKYTYVAGQDDRLPYDPEADFTTQLNQSFNQSLKNLNTDYIDSYVLHGPNQRFIISDIDEEVYSAMEELHKNKKIRHIGVSNIDINQLKHIYDYAEIKPEFVQNRCYAQLGWDKEIRNFCKENGISYQGFSLLTANRNELNLQEIHDISKKYNKSISQIIFRFASQIEMLPITGTTSEKHMTEDLDILDFELNNEEMDLIENISICL